MNKIKMFMPANRLQSNLAIAFSIFALFFAVGSSNVPCLSADTCAVGSDETFSGTLSIQNGTNYNLQVTGNPTANRVLTLPDATGTVALTSDIPSVPTLTASKIMATDGAGVYSTTNIYPLSLGTVGQVLTVNSLQTELEYSSITGVPTLTASKSVATDGTGALTTTDVYPLSLTASTPLKTNPTGEVTASDLDITTDITAGTSLQQIRTNAGGTALEFFTPSGGGGRWSLVANGTGVMYGNTLGICWYDTTQGADASMGGGLDQTKVYKLVIEPVGPQNGLTNNSSWPAMVTMNETNCSTIASANNYLYASTVSNNGFWGAISSGKRNRDSHGTSNNPWYPYQQGQDGNNTVSNCGSASISMTIQNGVKVSLANTRNDGVKFTQINASAPCFDTSGVKDGWQQQEGSFFNWDSTQTYTATGVDNMNQLTGMIFKRYDGDGTWSSSDPVWALWEEQ